MSEGKTSRVPMWSVGPEAEEPAASARAVATAIPAPVPAVPAAPAAENVNANGNGHPAGNGHASGGANGNGNGVGRAIVTDVVDRRADASDQRPLRVYIAGAHSTGKTTLARWVSRHFDLPIVTEVARSVLAEMELPLTVLRTDIDRTRDFQREVFTRQERAEDIAGARFVSDRTFDNLAYMAHHTMGLRDILPQAERYCERLRAPGSIVFFVRPHQDLLAQDGVRAGVVWEEIIRIDGMVKCLLELQGVDYVTIDTVNMAERARTVRGVLRMLGARPVAEQRAAVAIA